MSRFDEASLASEAARCLRQLGDLQAARRQAERVLALRSGERARSRAFGQLTLATTLVEQGELDTACAVGYQAVDSTRAVGSFLVVQQLDDVRRLLEPHRSVRAVAEFLAYLREGIRGRAWLSQWPSADPWLPDWRWRRENAGLAPAGPGSGGGRILARLAWFASPLVKVCGRHRGLGRLLGSVRLVAG